MATRLMGRAHAATTVSEPLASDLRGRHPGLLVEVIENGIELDQIRRAQQRADDFREVGRFVVAYTGNFFGMQRASEFLDGVEAALIAEPMMSDDLLIRFIGGLKPHEQKRAIGLGGIVEHTEFLRHDDVLAQQRAADLLLLYVAPGRGSQGVFTGKVFEYVAARRPVLALAPADNVASTLLGEARSTRTSGGALVTDFTAKSIADALIAAWQEWQRAGGPDGGRTADINVSEELLSSLDRSAGARRLADLVRRVVHA